MDSSKNASDVHFDRQIHISENHLHKFCEISLASADH